MLPPGPRSPAVWQTLRFMTQPLAYSRGLVARYGPAIRVNALNGRGVAVASPELARAVFAADPDTFETAGVLPELFGARSVLATHGPVHRRQRKLLNPRFHGTRIKALSGTMQRVIERHLSEWARAAQSGQEVVVAEFAQTLTLDIILETVFGADPSFERPGRAFLVELLSSMSPAIVASPALRNRFSPPWRRFVEARARFDAWVNALISKRQGRVELGGDSDILGLLLEARYEDGSPMALAEIRDQLMTLLAAGHETTAVALSWAVYWLLREPDVLARLRTELDTLGSKASAADLVRAPYLEAVASEALRIEPIVTDVARVCRKPLELGPWTVPAGELVFVLLCTILRDECVFSEPDRFRPERFLENTYGPSEFLPFGGGQRRCLGAAFAEAELALALASIARDWDLVLASEAPERAVRRNITMGPKFGVRVRVLGPRASASAPASATTATAER